MDPILDVARSDRDAAIFPYSFLKDFNRKDSCSRSIYEGCVSVWMVVIVFLLLFSFSAAPAAASLFAANRGIGIRALSMGGAFTGVADDPFAVYYNPAGLAQLRGHHLEVDYIMVIPRVYLETGSAKEQFIDHRLKMPMVGIALDLSKGIKLPRNLVLGLNFYFGDNAKSLWKVRVGSLEYDPYYALYGANLHGEEALGVWLGSGFELFPWLMLGASINFDFNTRTIGADVGMDTSLQPVDEAGKVFIDITAEIFPVFGVLFKPTSRLRVGLTWREGGIFILGGGAFEGKGRLVIDEDNILEVPFSANTQFGGAWRPDQYALGVAYQLRDDILLAVDMVYCDYRPFVDDAIRRPDPPMKAIVVPKLGIEYFLKEDVALRTGYSFRPSPLSQQRAGYHTNFIDNDVHALSLGLGYSTQLFGFPRKPVEICAAYQLFMLTPRTFQNVHANEPDLKSTGMFHSISLGFRFSM